MSYEKEAARLEREYWAAVGWCLQYGIKVHDHGRMLSLGELRDAIDVAEGREPAVIYNALARAFDERAGL